MTKLTVAAARDAQSIGKDACLQAWVRTRRDSKAGFSFLELNDGSCQGNIQVIAGADLPNYEKEVKHLAPGCSVSVEGQIVASQGQGQATEVKAKSLTVHGWAGDDFNANDARAYEWVGGRWKLRTAPEPAH